jgi:Protein of unknown function (DUF1552)
MSAARGRLPRRHFLRGFGGAVIALPWLDLDGVARAATAGPVAKRFVGFGVWDGVIPAQWFPTGPETGFTLPPLLAPLARHQARLVVTKGIDNTAALKSAERNGHAEGVASLLTAYAPHEMPKGSNNWFVPAGAISVDQAIAAELDRQGVVTRARSLHLATQGNGSYSGISFANGSPLPASGVAQAFSALFGDPKQSAAALARAAARRKSILDGSLADYQRLVGRVSGEDRQRVSAHLEALRSLETRLAAAGPACDASTFDPMTPTKDVAWRAMMEIAALAMSCDLTRVVTLSFEHAGGGGPPLPWIGIDTDMHELSHGIVPAKPGDKVLADFAKVVQWFTGELATFVDRLKGIKLPDGTTLLDETIVFQGSEISFNHDQPDMPFLLVAGEKTPVRAGRFVQATPKTPHNALLLTLLHAFGGQATAFGDPRYAAGDLDASFLT